MAAEDFVISILVKQEVSKALKEIEDQIQGLDARLNKIQRSEGAFNSAASAANKFGTSVKNTKGSVDALADAELRVRAAQIQYNQALKAATDISEDNVKTLDTTNKKLQESSVALIRARDNLRRVTQEYRKVQQGSAGFLNNLLKQQSSLSEFTRRLDVAIQRVITYRLAFGTFQQISNAIGDTFDQVVRLDASFADLQKVLRTNEANLNTLRDSAFRLGKEFGRSADDIVTGFKTFAQQGLNTAGIIDRTRTLLLAVSATTLDTKGAIEALTAAANIFEGQFENLNIIVDKWLAVERQVPVQAADFANAIKGLGFVANELGITMDELNGIVAAVGSTTRKSGTAIATSFRTILSRATSDEAVKAFQDLGISVLQADRTFRPFGDVIRDLGDRWDNLTQPMRLNIATVLGARRRYTDFLALMNNYDEFLKSTAVSQNALGDAQAASLLEIDKLSRRLEAVNTSFSELKEAVGSELVKQFVELVESLEEVLSNLKSNSEAVADIIRTSVKWIGTLSAISFLLRIVSSLYRLTGKNVFELARATEGHARATLISARALATLRAVALPLVSIIFILVEAYNLWSAATDEAIFKQEELNEIMKFNEAAAEEAARQIAVAAGELNKFQVIQAVGAENRTITKLNDSLTEARERLDTLVSAEIVLNKQFQKQRKELEKTLGENAKYDESLIALERSLQNIRSELDKEEDKVGRFTAAITAAEARIAQLHGFGVPFEAINALKIFDVRRRLKILSTSLNEIKEGTNFEGIDLDLSSGRELKIRPRFVIDKNAAKELRERITFEVKQAREELDSLLKGENLDKAPKNLQDTANAVGKLTGTQAKVARLTEELERLDSTISTNSETIRFFGGETSEAESRISALRKAFQDLDSQILELRGKERVIQETFAQDPGISFDLEGNIIVQESSDQLKQQIITDLLEEGRKITKDILILEKIRNALQDQFSSQVKKDLQEIIRLRSESAKIDTEIVKQNANYNLQISAIKAIQSSLTGVSRSRLLDQDVLDKQLNAQEEIIRLEQARDDAADRLRIKNLETKKTTESQVRINNILQRIEQRRFNTQVRIQQLQADALENLNRELTTIQNSIRTGISGALSQLPSNIAERAQAEDELANRRLEAEDALARARAANDAAAINTALNNLAEIERESERIGSIFEDVFLGIASTISEIRFQKLADNLADTLLEAEFKTGSTVGRSIANEISGGVSQTIDILKTRLIEGFQSGAILTKEAILSAYLETFGRRGLAEFTGDSQDFEEAARTGIIAGSKSLTTDVSTGIEESSTKGANTFKSALNASFSIGAQLIGQSLFGGGRGAAAGSGVGALLGSAAFREIGFLTSALGSFAGPLGTIAGSLVGGALGSLFDDSPAISNLNTAIQENTTAIKNNNELLSLEREFINTPARFVPEALFTGGAFPGGINGGLNIEVNVVGGSGTPTEIGNAVAESVARELQDSTSRSRSQATRFA